MQYTSQMIFLYFKNFEKGCEFLEKVLELKEVFNPGWAVVYQSVNQGFIGAVKAEEGSIDSSKKGGSLISLTVEDIHEAYEVIQKRYKYVSEIKFFEDIHLYSFLIQGPEEYTFEIQSFNDQHLEAIF
ncbi:MAG: VOC family protein [Clostridia bacterium]|nr:VOC family protein [Clostridia bacterium]